MIVYCNLTILPGCLFLIELKHIYSWCLILFSIGILGILNSTDNLRNHFFKLLIVLIFLFLLEINTKIYNDLIFECTKIVHHSKILVSKIMLKGSNSEDKAVSIHIYNFIIIMIIMIMRLEIPEKIDAT